jgi:hypothetical protein
VIDVTPQLLKQLDIIGLVLNFVGGLLLAYDLFNPSCELLNERLIKLISK